MNTINKRDNIKIYWKIFRGVNKITENFDSTNLRVFVVGTDNTYWLKPTINKSIEPNYEVLEMNISGGRLETGVYDIKAIWQKNGGRHTLMSARTGVFAITNNYRESNDEKVIRLASYVESYGRDGMSAYEIAVMRNKVDDSVSEQDWIDNMVSGGIGDGSISGEKLSDGTISKEKLDGALQNEIDKIADRTESENSMGYVVLRNGERFKDQVEGKSNTVFEIRYGFDLKDSDVTIPDNCVLKFVGGSLSNGRVIGNNFSIDAPKDVHIFNNVVLGGIAEVYAAWFGVNPSNEDNSLYLEQALRSTSLEYTGNRVVRFDSGTYNFEKTIDISSTSIVGAVPVGKINGYPYNDEYKTVLRSKHDGALFYVENKEGMDFPFASVNIKNVVLSHDEKRGNSIGVDVKRGNISIEDSLIFSFSRGVNIYASISSKIESTDFGYNVTAIYINNKAGDVSTSLYFEKCYIYESDVHFRNEANSILDCHFRGCIFESSKQESMIINPKGFSVMHLTDCYSENNGRSEAEYDIKYEDVKKTDYIHFKLASIGNIWAGRNGAEYNNAFINITAGTFYSYGDSFTRYNYAMHIDDTNSMKVNVDFNSMIFAGSIQALDEGSRISENANIKISTYAGDARTTQNLIDKIDFRTKNIGLPSVGIFSDKDVSEIKTSVGLKSKEGYARLYENGVFAIGARRRIGTTTSDCISLPMKDELKNVLTASPKQAFIQAVKSYDRKQPSLYLSYTADEATEDGEEKDYTDSWVNALIPILTQGNLPPTSLLKDGEIYVDRNKGSIYMYSHYWGRNITLVDGSVRSNYVVLESDKPFAEQVTKPNTIYEIRYDFKLAEDGSYAQCDLPENCVLKFCGGSIQNGLLVATNGAKIFDGKLQECGIWAMSNLEVYNTEINISKDIDSTRNCAILVEGLSSEASIIVENCKIVNTNHRSGGEVYYGGGIKVPTETYNVNLLVRGNYIETNNFGVETTTFDSTLNAVISDNIIIAVGAHGLGVSIPSKNTISCVISNNVITASEICMEVFYNTTCIGNTVIGKQVDNNPPRGVELSSVNGVLSKNCKIIGNTFNAYLRVFLSKDAFIFNNTFNNCGISIDGSHNCVVENNVFKREGEISKAIAPISSYDISILNNEFIIEKLIIDGTFGGMSPFGLGDYSGQSIAKRNIFKGNIVRIGQVDEIVNSHNSYFSMLSMSQIEDASIRHLNKEEDNIIVGYNDAKNGTSEQRPQLSPYFQGFQYFDTTLGKQIWWTGTKWVDATGVDVSLV